MKKKREKKKGLRNMKRKKCAEVSVCVLINTSQPRERAHAHDIQQEPWHDEQTHWWLRGAPHVLVSSLGTHNTY